MKTCTACGESFPVSEFYADDCACKPCRRARVKANREARREQYAMYERERFQRPERRRSVSEYQRRMRAEHPEKRTARIAVGNALRDGRLVRQPCAFCGTTVRVQAHHHDYSRPLEVEWACFRCHREKCHGQVVISPAAHTEAA